MGFLLESFTTELIIVVITLLIYAFYKIRDHQRYFAKRGMNYVSGIFPFGSLWPLFIFKKSFGQAMDQIYEKFPDKSYVGFFFGTKPAILIRDPQLVNDVLVKSFSNFHDRSVKTMEINGPLDNNLVQLTGQKWKTLRGKLAPTFTSGKLKWMFDVINDSSEGLKHLLNNIADDSDKPIKDIFARFTTDVIASCAFGIDGEAMKDPNCKFREMAKSMLKPGTWALIKATFIMLFPTIAKKLKIKPSTKKFEDFFINLTKQGLDYRKETGIVRNDFLQLLLHLREKGYVDFDNKDILKDETNQNLDAENESKLKITDELLAAQAFIFFAAGFENSANVMAFTTYLLSKHPQIQDEVRREINSTIEKHGCLTYNALKEMKLTEGCINESLRFYPPGEGLMRNCNMEFDLKDGHKIDENISVLIPTWSLHRDPNYFPEPMKFNPHRWLNDYRPLSGTFLPFGDGPRICIAERFARLEIKLGIVIAVKNFQLYYSKKNQEPLRFKASTFQEPIGGLWIRLTKI